MKTTSHFVGIALDSSYFADLFVDLQQYAKSHDLEDILELQNPLSVHITLYYLEDSLSQQDRVQILQDISELSSEGASTIAQLKSAYFGSPGQERVCYLGCPQDVKFTEVNQFFAKKYKRLQIPENQLEFVPHISLFRIKNPTLYAPHKAEIDKLVDKATKQINCDGLVEGLRLFQVSSLYRPEIQIPIRPV